MANIKHYRLYIKLLKLSILICFCVFVILGIFAAFDDINIENKQATNDHNNNFLNKGKLSSASDVTLTNPRFFGLSTDLQPYTILAKKGLQVDKNLIELDDVFGDIIVSKNKIIALKANNGLLKINTHDVELHGQVEVLIDDEYILSTETLFINFKKKSGYGKEPVQVSNDLGVITADEFEIAENYEEVIFKGNRVKTIIYNMLVN